jgi:hypothetical protein
MQTKNVNKPYEKLQRFINHICIGFENLREKNIVIGFFVCMINKE